MAAIQLIQIVNANAKMQLKLHNSEQDQKHTLKYANPQLLYYKMYSSLYRLKYNYLFR